MPWLESVMSGTRLVVDPTCSTWPTTLIVDHRLAVGDAVQRPLLIST